MRVYKHYYFIIRGEDGNEKLEKSNAFFVIAVMCYAMVQIVYTISHMIAEEQNSIITEIIEHSVNLLWFALIFAPVIIFVLRSGLQNSKRIFLNFWKKHYIYYILYIAILYWIRENIGMGFYSIDLPIPGLYFDLSKNAFADFWMMYTYMLFYDITATLFFILLPNYFLCFTKKEV